MSTTLLDIGTIVPDFTKNKVQQDFMACKTRYQLYSGGFGSGKTTACCVKIQVISALMPNNLCIVFRQNYPDLRDSTRKVFFELLPRDWIKYWKESENSLTLKNGSQILFRYFENKSIKVGPNIGGFFVDQAEECDEDVFKALMGRMRRNVARQYGLLAMNPNGEDWQHKLFIKNKNPNFSFFTSSTFDNKENLPSTYISDMMTAYSADWIDRFVYGKWNKMSGLIYHEFDDNLHVIDPFAIPMSWVKGRGNDWGIDAPATCSFVARSPEGIYYVFDEYGAPEMTPEEHADAILSQSKPYGSFRANLLDQSAFSKGSDLKSIADKYRAKGYHCLPATRELLASIATIKQLHKQDKIFYFRGRTEEHLREKKSWKWGARQAGKEVPARGNDHYLDGERYIIHWMEKKLFDRGSATVEQMRERMDGKLNMQTKEECDPVTGLPA